MTFVKVKSLEISHREEGPRLGRAQRMQVRRKKTVKKHVPVTQQVID